jgi:hypothetical protein
MNFWDTFISALILALEAVALGWLVVAVIRGIYRSARRAAYRRARERQHTATVAGPGVEPLVDRLRLPRRRGADHQVRLGDVGLRGHPVRTVRPGRGQVAAEHRFTDPGVLGKLSVSHVSLRGHNSRITNYGNTLPPNTSG